MKSPVFISGTFALLLLLASSAVAQTQPMNDKPDGNIAFASVEISDSQLVYAHSGNINKPGVLFIHGTPGDWQAFDTYLQDSSLQQDFFMVSVDRLGWGQSKVARSDADGDFALQATSMVKVMQNYPDKQWIIVGHSLGASMAPKIALQAPRNVSGLLLLAGSLSPRLGKPRWFNRLAATWLAKRLIPGQLGRSNDEIMVLSRQLTLMDQQIRATRLDTRLVVMQGGKDKLVSPRNPRYVEQHWMEQFSEVSLVELPDAGHFLPWQQTDLVIEQIRELSRAIETN